MVKIVPAGCTFSGYSCKMEKNSRRLRDTSEHFDGRRFLCQIGIIIEGLPRYFRGTNIKAPFVSNIGASSSLTKSSILKRKLGCHPMRIKLLGAIRRCGGYFARLLGRNWKPSSLTTNAEGIHDVCFHQPDKYIDHCVKSLTIRLLTLSTSSVLLRPQRIRYVL